MGASQADDDGRFLLVVLVAMNALAIAAVFELGGVLRVFAFLSQFAVLVTGIGLWTARTVDRGLEGSTKLREWRRRAGNGRIRSGSISSRSSRDPLDAVMVLRGV
jgi:hypothetical protein